MPERVIEFGPYRLESERVYDSRNQPIELPEQAIKVLLVLLEHTLSQGQTSLSGEAIRRAVWHNRDVDKNNLHQQIIRLRKAFGAQAIVSTSGPRGYRFALPVRMSGPASHIRWRAISVLPFVCPPGYFKDEDRLRLAGYHLALGLIEQLRNLTSLELRELSPEYMQPGWQPNAVQIARAQRSDLVLSGHLVTASTGDELRLQLIEAATANVIWAGKLVVNSADSVKTEQLIAQQVAQALGFDEIARAAARKSAPPHPEAVAHCRKGRYLYSTKLNCLDEAFEEFTYALALDPTYAEPWVGIADVWVLRCTFGQAVLSPNEGMPKVLTAATRALELDPHSSTAHAARASAAGLWEWNFDLAEQHLRTAIELRPDNEFAYQWLARVLLMQGKREEAVRVAERGWELAPHLPYIGALLALFHYFAGHQERANELCCALIAQWPMFPVSYAVHAFVQEATGELEAAVQSALTAIQGGDPLISLSTLGCVYGRMGRKAEAENLLEQLAERRQRHYVSPYYDAVIHAGLGNHAAALQLLTKAYEDRSEMMPHLRVDHRLRSLHDTPQFQKLLQQVGI